MNQKACGAAGFEHRTVAGVLGEPGALRDPAGREADARTEPVRQDRHLAHQWVPDLGIAGSVTWVKMPSAESATQLGKLEDTYGSGDVTPFGTKVLEAGGFRFTGKHYRSRLDRKLVVIAETDPIKGRPSEAFLKQVADVADVLPPP